MKFKDAMTKIGLDSAKSGIAHSMEEAWEVQRRIAERLVPLVSSSNSS